MTTTMIDYDNGIVPTGLCSSICGRATALHKINKHYDTKSYRGLQSQGIVGPGPDTVVVSAESAPRLRAWIAV